METAVSLLDPRIVAGHDHVAAEDLRALIELAELEIAVTVDAGIRSPSVLITVHELVHYLLPEFILKIKNIVRDAEVHADRPCIFDIIQGTACLGIFDDDIVVAI